MRTQPLPSRPSRPMQSVPRPQARRTGRLLVEDPGVGQGSRREPGQLRNCLTAGSGAPARRFLLQLPHANVQPAAQPCPAHLLLPLLAGASPKTTRLGRTPVPPFSLCGLTPGLEPTCTIPNPRAPFPPAVPAVRQHGQDGAALARLHGRVPARLQVRPPALPGPCLPACRLEVFRQARWQAQASPACALVAFPARLATNPGALKPINAWPCSDPHASAQPRRHTDFVTAIDFHPLDDKMFLRWDAPPCLLCCSAGPSTHRLERRRLAGCRWRLPLAALVQPCWLLLAATIGSAGATLLAAAGCHRWQPWWRLGHANAPSLAGWAPTPTTPHPPGAQRLHRREGAAVEHPGAARGVVAGCARDGDRRHLLLG